MLPRLPLWPSNIGRAVTVSQRPSGACPGRTKISTRSTVSPTAASASGNCSAGRGVTPSAVYTPSVAMSFGNAVASSGKPNCFRATGLQIRNLPCSSATITPWRDLVENRVQLVILMAQNLLIQFAFFDLSRNRQHCWFAVVLDDRGVDSHRDGPPVLGAVSPLAVPLAASIVLAHGPRKTGGKAGIFDLLHQAAQQFLAPVAEALAGGRVRPLGCCRRGRG